VLLVPAGPVVYAIGAASGRVTVARVDITTRTPTARRTFSGEGVHASVGGGQLAILLTPERSPNTPPPATVQLLDLDTLATVASRDLTTAATVLARPEATYVSTPGRILALDPKTLHTIRTIDVDNYPKQHASGAEIAADPRSHILYAGIPNSYGPLPPVDIVDLRTGRVIARRGVPAVVVAEPQGYGDDGWIVFATGNFASAELLNPAGKVLTGFGPIGPNSSSIVVTGRHLWTFPTAEGFPLTCRNLRSGAVQGSAQHQRIEAASAADNTHVYLAHDSTLSVFTPSGACA
jgi:hypothetical protein